LLYLVGYLYYWQMGFNSVFKGLKDLSITKIIYRRIKYKYGTLTEYY